ncbi:hypothetical protein SAMD00023353_0700840 [Rosellinia necatrix]|uniref:Uncharacterized protein n=1 Tax=Rosellinia necatrix TaxID=77044 RepID=A0A1S7ULS2_ROSNE|nr:hypothetical protein SAMD00023353_0700840 [Rosellinia necatrix]
MASLQQSMAKFGSHGTKYKDSKSKTRPAVKPILKKWSQSERDKRSLDLDRGWDEQDGQYQSSQGWGRSSSLSFGDQVVASADAAIVMTGGGVSGTVGAGMGVLPSTTATRRYNHSRSISGTSHASGTTSNSSNGVPTPRQAGATFVHPFQQMPRTSTPPMLSYANSLASIADTRDYSPTTITEDEDDEDGIASSVEPSTNQQHYNIGSHGANSVYAHHPTFHTNLVNTSNSVSQPTLVSQFTSPPSQRTSSTDISDNSPKLPPHPALRVNTSRVSSSIPAHSRLANVPSRSDLGLDHLVDPPALSNLPPTTITSPSSSTGPMSPLRTSLDGAFPRLRGKSDPDAVIHPDPVIAARRKFEMKERAKDEKYAREQIKRRQRADDKRAREQERQQAAQYKEQLAARAREETAELEEALQRGKHNRKISLASSSRPSLTMARPSLSLGRPSISRKNTANQMSEPEKFSSSSYDDTNPKSPPAHGRDSETAHSVQFAAPKRKSTARKKTQSAWTTFLLWLRTKLLRLRKH